MLGCFSPYGDRNDRFFMPSSRSLLRLWQPGNTLTECTQMTFPALIQLCWIASRLRCSQRQDLSTVTTRKQRQRPSYACIIVLCLRLPRNDAQRRILLLQCSRKDNRFIVIARSNATWRTRMATITKELDCFSSFTASQGRNLLIIARSNAMWQ